MYFLTRNLQNVCTTNTSLLKCSVGSDEVGSVGKGAKRIRLKRKNLGADKLGTVF